MLTAAHNILRKKHMKGKFKINFILIIEYFLILIVTFLIMSNLLRLNYIYPLSVTPLIIGIISWIKVKGNLVDVLETVASLIFITILVYNIIIFIYPEAISNHFALNVLTILRVPITEWLFAICLGVGCTYTYEAVFNLK